MKAKISGILFAATAFVLAHGWFAEVKSQPKDLIESAKSEGEFVFYSGIPVPDAQALLSAFEKKYPFIKTTHYRATGPALVSPDRD